MMNDNYLQHTLFMLSAAYLQKKKEENFMSHSLQQTH